MATNFILFILVCLSYKIIDLTKDANLDCELVETTLFTLIPDCKKLEE